MTGKLLPLLPSHKQYCEPYFGGGSVFFAKQPCDHETINDLDEAVMAFFRVLRDRGDELERRCEDTEYHEGLWEECRATWQKEEDELLRVWKWFVVARQSFSGHFGASHSHTRTHVSRGRSDRVNSWRMVVSRLPEVRERLLNTQIFCGEALRAMRCCDTVDCLHYVDPPYVHATRRGGPDNPNDGRYAHEMDDAQHAELVAYLLDECEGKVVLSGYRHPLYAPLESAGWSRVDFETACHAAAKTRGTGIQGAGSALEKQSRTESVWLCLRTAAEVL